MIDLNTDAWVCEKLEMALAALGRIADIAKDPETPAWLRLRRKLT